MILYRTLTLAWFSQTSQIWTVWHEKIKEHLKKDRKTVVWVSHQNQIVRPVEQEHRQDKWFRHKRRHTEIHSGAMKSIQHCTECPIHRCSKSIRKEWKKSSKGQHLNQWTQWVKCKSALLADTVSVNMCYYTSVPCSSFIWTAKQCHDNQTVYLR